MTTIAWDGKTMAADKQMTTWSMPHESIVPKMRRIMYHGAPAIAAGCGTVVYSEAMLDWIEAGCHEDTKPELPTHGTGDSVTVMVVTAQGVYEYIDSHRPIPLGTIKWAIGTGNQFAFGAMDAGASAKRAVEIAIGRDIDSGFGVATFTLGGKK